MLKTSGGTESKTRPGEGGVGVGGSRAGREGSKLDGSELCDGEVDGGEVETMRLGRKFKKGLSPRIRLSPRICLSLLWTFLPPKLN